MALRWFSACTDSVRVGSLVTLYHSGHLKGITGDKRKAFPKLYIVLRPMPVESAAVKVFMKFNNL